MVLLQHKLSVKLSQRQILTPGLVQMVSVLALNKLELKDMINAEMVENPVLEELDGTVPLLDEVAGKEAELDRPLLGDVVGKDGRRRHIGGEEGQDPHHADQFAYPRRHAPVITGSRSGRKRGRDRIFRVASRNVQMRKGATFAP